MKKYFNLLLILLFISISMVDIFIASGLLILIVQGFTLSFITFYLGASRFKLYTRNNFILLIINLVILLITYKYKFYLFNIFLLSFILWSAATPILVKYNKLISFSILSAFVVLYYFSLMGASMPLFPLLFYPIYVFGYKINFFEFTRSWKLIIVIILTLALSTFILFVLYNETRIYDLFGNLLFLKALKSDSQLAMYTPFVYIFSLLLSLTINLSIYIFTTIFEHTKDFLSEYKYNISTISKAVYGILILLFTATILIFLSKYVLLRDLNLTLESILLPHTIFNIIFIASIYLTLISVLGRGLSSLIFYTICLLLIFANFIKLKFFNEPFYPWDLYLIKNALMISKEYISPLLITLISGVSALLIILGVYHKNYIKKVFRIKPMFLLLPFVIILIYINLTILNTPRYSGSLGIQKSWYVGKDEILNNGFFVQNYFYLTDLNKYLFTKPSGYSSKNINAINDSLASTKAVQASISSPKKLNLDIKPNIIVIMSEAFWDPTILKGVSFNIDITKNLKQYQRGYIVSPVFGGETANTEFEALTGLSNYFLNTGVIPYNVYLRKPTPSIVSVLKDNGYSATAIHPNVPDFYNRAMVYKNLGFDQFLDINSFNRKTDFKGHHVSDDKLIDKILNNLEDGDKPKFIFAVSIQNHDPYYNIYKSTEVKATSPKLDATETSILSNYGQNIYDADTALGRLIAALKDSKKPTLVYFFGDHLPRLGEPYGVYDIYNKLDYFKGSKNIYKDIISYETPFVRWSNYKELEENPKDISPAQITLDILKDSNIMYPSYFNILGQLRGIYPVLSNHLYDKVDNNNEVIKNYKLIEYDLMFGNQYLKSLK